MVLCIGCQIKAAGPCDRCGNSVAPNGAAEQRFDFFDNPMGVGTWISPALDRQAANLIVEAFPVSAGTGSVQVLDGPLGGQLTATTDSNGFRNNITARTKFLVKGPQQRIAVQLIVSSGVWQVSGAYTDQASDRGQYYDRHQSPMTFLYQAAAVAPHAKTQRWSYTVPAGRKAWAEMVFLRSLRDGAATSSGNMFNFIQITRGGGVQTTILELFQNATAMNTYTSDKLTGQMSLAAGDNIAGYTEDASSDGTYNYNSAAAVTEFDA